MKFKVQGTELNNILKKVIKGYNSKEDNSYVAIKLDLEKEKLILTSRSRATFFEGKLSAHAIEVDEGEPLVYHLDGEKLKQLVSILPDAPVDVSFEINNTTRSFTIKTMVSKYKLPVSSETPLAPAPEVDEYLTVDANDFMNVIKDLIKILPTDPSYQEHQISCMHLELDPEEKMKMFATDAHALGSVLIDSEELDLDEKKEILIRHTEMGTLSDTFGKGETLTLVGSDDMFGYIDETDTLSLVGVINMTPLDTRQIEALTEDKNTFVVDKGELKSAVETVSKLAAEDNTIDIDIKEDMEDIRVSNRYGDYIDVSPKEVNFEEDGKASFNTETFLKSLNPASDGDVRLEFGSLSGDRPGATRIVSLHANGDDNEEISLISIGAQSESV